MQQFLFSILAGVIIAFFTSWITVRFAVKQFFSERWWDRKADVYSKIVEALYHIKHKFQADLAAEERGVPISEKREEELKKYASKAREELNLVEGMGAFVISKKVASTLTQLISNLEGEDENPYRSYYDYLDRYLSHVNKCLEEVRFQALRDLNIEL